MPLSLDASALTDEDEDEDDDEDVAIAARIRAHSVRDCDVLSCSAFSSDCAAVISARAAASCGVRVSVSVCVCVCVCVRVCGPMVRRRAVTHNRCARKINKCRDKAFSALFLEIELQIPLTIKGKNF